MLLKLVRRRQQVETVTTLLDQDRRQKQLLVKCLWPRATAVQQVECNQKRQVPVFAGRGNTGRDLSLYRRQTLATIVCTCISAWTTPSPPVHELMSIGV